MWASKDIQCVDNVSNGSDVDDYARAIADLQIESESAEPPQMNAWETHLPPRPAPQFSSVAKVASVVDDAIPQTAATSTPTQDNINPMLPKKKPVWTAPHEMPQAYLDYSEGTPNETIQYVPQRTKSAVKELRRNAKNIKHLEAQVKSLSDETAKLTDQCGKAKEEVKSLRAKNREAERKLEEEAQKGRLGRMKDKASHEEMIIKQLEKRQKNNNADMDGMDDLGIDFTVGPQGFLRQLATYIHRLFSYLYLRYAPFRKDIKYIQGKFGESISLYFTFHLWVFFVSLAISLMVFSMFGAAHLANLVTEQSEDLFINQSDTQNETVIPEFPFGWLLYSSFIEDEKMLVVMGIMLVGVSHLLAFLWRLIFALKTSSFRQYEEEYFQSVRYSKTALSMLFDISARSQRDEEVLKLSSVAALQMLIHQDNQKISESTPTKLIVKRVVSIFFQTVLIGGSWVGLLAITLNEDEIVNAFSTSEDSQIVQNFALFIPSLCITVVTMMLPPLLILATRAEQWENPELMLVIMVTRLYLSQMAVLVIVMLQGLRFLTSHKYKYNCPQDAFALELIKLIVAKVVGKMTGAIAYLTSRTFAFRFILKKPDGGSEFNTAKEIVDLLYVQALLWLVLPFCPMFVVSGALLLLIVLKFQIYLVTQKLKRPSLLWSPKQTTGWFLFLFFATFILCQAANYYLIAVFDDHKCGPFKGDTQSMLDWLTVEATKDGGAKTFLDVFFSPILLLAYVCMVVVMLYKKQYQRDALQEHILYSKEQLKNDAEMYTKQIHALRGQVAELEDKLIDYQQPGRL